MDLIDKVSSLSSSLSTSQLILIGSSLCIILAGISSKIRKKVGTPKADKKTQGIGSSKQLYLKVVDYVNEGKINDACTILEQLGKIDEAVGIYEQTGMIKEASNLLVRSGSSGKAAWLAHKHGLYELALDIYIKMGDYEGAGNCYAMRQDWEHAIECFERCKDYQKEVLCCLQLELYQQAGMACIAMQDYNEAINCFKMLVDKTEDISSIHLEPEAVAVIEDYVKNVDGSCVELIDLVALSSDLSEIVFHYASINNISVAVNIALRSVINIGSVLLDRSSVDQRFNDDICKNLAIIFREAGNIKVSAGFFKKIKNYQDAADMYLNAGDKAQARECYTLGGMSIPQEALEGPEADYNTHSDTIITDSGAGSNEEESLKEIDLTTEETSHTNNQMSDIQIQSDSVELSSNIETKPLEFSDRKGLLQNLSSSISKSISIEQDQKVGSRNINLTNVRNDESNNKWVKYRFFSNLDQDQISIIESCLIKEEVEEGQVLIEKGKEASGIFFILDGTVFIDGEESLEVEFGDELINAQPSPYQLSCKTKVNYKLLSKDTLLSFLQNDMFSDQIKSAFNEVSSLKSQKAS